MVTLVVQPVGINQYNELVGALPSVETTIISYTVPAGKNFYIINFSGKGTAKATFSLKVNGSVQSKKDMDVSDRNPIGEFSHAFGLKTSVGDLILVTVTNTSSVLGNYQANLHGGLQ